MRLLEGATASFERILCTNELDWVDIEDPGRVLKLFVCKSPNPPVAISCYLQHQKTETFI